jgi:phenylacetate-CoA ligase
MPDHFDRLENRPHAARESALMRDLKHVLAIAKPRAPSLRAQLRGVDVAKIKTRADLAQIPVIRRADLLAMQADSPPFGGANATRLAGLKQAFFIPGMLALLEGQAKDWWGMGRALFAAGLRKGVPVLNCFPYDLVPEGPMVESGASAIGCPVIPAGAAPIDQKVDVIARLKPGFFCGRADEFKTIIDRAIDLKVDTTCIKNALVTGRTSKGLRSEYSLRGFKVRHAFIRPELGVVAFESGATEGMTVNEGIILEVIDVETRCPVPSGAEGEIVVTRINSDFPILRYATGAISAVSAHPATCGRTNMRILPPQERTPDFVEFCGHRIHLSDIYEIAKQHPSVGRISLVMRRRRDNDEVHLRVEHGGEEAALKDRLSETLRRLTRMTGTVELIRPGTMSDDDAMIVDERPLN